MSEQMKSSGDIRLQSGEEIVREAMAEIAPDRDAPTAGKIRIPLTHRTGVKAAAFILTVAMTAVTVASVVAAALMITGDVYVTPQEAYREEIFANLAEGVVSDTVWRLTNGDEADAVNSVRHKNVAGISLDFGEGNDRSWAYGAAAGNIDCVCYESRWLILSGGEIARDRGYYTEAELAEMRASAFTACVYVPMQLTAQDEFLLADMALDAVYAMRYWVYAVGAAALILGVAFFVFLMCASGRRNGMSEPQPGWGTKIPFDVTTAAAFFALCLMMALLSEMSYFAAGTEVAAAWVLCGVAAMVVLLGWCMSAALRLKLGRWWENTVICFALRFCIKIAGQLLRGTWRCIRGGVSLLRRIPLVGKTAAVFAAAVFVEFIFMMSFRRDVDMLIITWFLLHATAFAAVVHIALSLRRLQKGGEALAAGDLSYQVDTKWMLPDFKHHAENLGSIGEGMTAAVEQRLKSERMKTELITNVSHDIKTPLTSIINYADLIGKEPCENEKITEYAAVLHRQSERLKRLIDDLVEASKASTGNLEVFLAPCEVGVLLSQTAGEYEERLGQCALTLVTKQPETPVKILADGRRLWRVFDNLMNNICKYAMPGTRVYLTLETVGDEAVISFKNTSREPMDLSADELTERFVRGDAARSSEGSGLGLSIAKSLVQLQRGTLELSVDGDLFKAVLRFPAIP